MSSIHAHGPQINNTRKQLENEPGSIILAWTLIEALSPQTYGGPRDLVADEDRDIADISLGGMPWDSDYEMRDDKKLFYQIILGAIPIGAATDALAKAFGANEEFVEKSSEKAIIAAFIVDHNGYLIQENAISISCFAWALPLALKLEFDVFGAWPRFERDMLQSLQLILSRIGKNGECVPVCFQAIQEAYRTLITDFALPPHLATPPMFAIKKYQKIDSKNSPEPLLLNSFFLKDLLKTSKLIQENNLPLGLNRYLGNQKPSMTFDLLKDKVLLQNAISPAMIPPACWPSPGGHPLVMLQQAAVNIAKAELSNKEGIISVNGPPGTGKTTLLRDIVSSCVFDRALAMIEFEDPNDAFNPSGLRIQTGQYGSFSIYKLSDTIKGHEVLVASANNKAVENITKELPALSAIGRSLNELSYFNSIGDVVNNPVQMDKNGRPKMKQPDPIKTWGLISACLGNSNNLRAFLNSFWWNDDYSLKQYLKAAKGDPVYAKGKNGEPDRISKIITNEKPPSPLASKQNWKKACERFISLKKDYEDEIAKLEAAKDLAFKIQKIKNNLLVEQEEFGSLLEKCSVLTEEISFSQIVFDDEANTHRRKLSELELHLRHKPSLFKRIFATEIWEIWVSEKKYLQCEESTAKRTRDIAKNALANFKMQHTAVKSEINNSEPRMTVNREEYVRIEEKRDQLNKSLDGRLVDDTLFKQGHDIWNTASPWINDRLHRLREDLFISALDVHKAFIDASAQKILHNLGVLVYFFSNRGYQYDSAKILLSDLWSTLFIAIPVISTTFSSISKMFSDLPASSLGWLLIDEAGQAAPQAAVGAILRAKRTLAVGDPQQIMPVTTLPDKLILEISKYFKIDQSDWLSPLASAQKLADHASAFQSSFQTDQGSRPVGLPLLVHRRCQEPMFGISNRIAYDNQMVYAAGNPKPSEIFKILGPSRWFPVEGEANSKYCHEEGELIIKLLLRIASSGITDPDLFIITPFKIVSEELEKRLKVERELFKKMKVNKSDWIKNRVGTIHTFQGREAESVFLMLGAPMSSHKGARDWATSTPNILNVAVSRAKRNLYVIGSHTAWSQAGHARELSSALSVEQSE